MAKIRCRLCKTEFPTSDKPGWKTCTCGAIQIDYGNGYFRVLGSFEDQEIIDDEL